MIVTTAAMVMAMNMAGAAAPPQPQTRVAPRGSYTSSCTGAYVNQGRLYADCTDRQRNVRGSSIELNRCSSSDIGNDNGLLVCSDHRGRYENNGGGNNGGGWGGGGGGGGWGGGNAIPSGSYQRSCNEIRVNRGELSAACQDRDRNRRSSVLDLNRCSGAEVRNQDGLLTCGNVSGRFTDNRPGGGGNWGGGRSSITVYSDANYRGQSATFGSEIINLRSSGLNDQISSIRTSGVWEVCTDANFRGDCRVIDGDVRNLDRSMNDKISSLRPINRGGGRW